MVLHPTLQEGREQTPAQLPSSTYVQKLRNSGGQVHTNQAIPQGYSLEWGSACFEET